MHILTSSTISMEAFAQYVDNRLTKPRSGLRSVATPEESIQWKAEELL